jgi:ribosomal protein S27AE
VSILSIFRPDRIPSLSRLPKELGREERPCTRCGESTEHILYRVPKKVVVLYVKDHSENLHATCVVCAKSTILTGEERGRILASLHDSQTPE